MEICHYIFKDIPPHTSNNFRVFSY